MKRVVGQDSRSDLGAIQRRADRQTLLRPAIPQVLANGDARLGHPRTNGVDAQIMPVWAKIYGRRERMRPWTPCLAT